jgi:hypothetical protein
VQSGSNVVIAAEQVIGIAPNFSVKSGGTLILRTGVTSPPSIPTPPVNQFVLAGQTATFTIVAGGTGPFTYVWKKNASTVVGTNSNQLNLTGVTKTNEGSYTCTVSNAGGTVTSAAATLSVNNLPTIAAISAKTTNEDTASAAITITVADTETPVANLVVNAVSSNTAIVAAGGISITGTTGSRSMILTPVTNANGTTTITVTVKDTGTPQGTASTSFVLTVTAVNDVPSFTKGADQTVLEDCGAKSIANWATAISAGPNEATQVVDFIVTNNNNALFSAQPAISPTGTLTFTPAANANGTATVTVKLHDNGGGTTNTSTAQTFVITVTAVNDAPTFVKGLDVGVAKNSTAKTVSGWATAISSGATNETQTLNFLVTHNNPTLFSVQPAISPTGVLTFTPAANQTGCATLAVVLHDNGGTANGGVDTSAPQSFVITVGMPINLAPSFTKGPNQTFLEDCGAKTVTAWATAISAGTGETTQVVDFQVTNNNNAMFSVQPAITPTGTLTFTPVANTSGVATVTVKLHDNGGIWGGGVDTSAAQTFTITITSVNDVPVFTKGANQTLPENSSAVTVANWATGISAGPLETTQVLNFIVNNSNPSAFSVQPAISPTGVLTFTPAPYAYGTTVVTVQIHDDGGTANGGVDTSAAQTFNITMNLSTPRTISDLAITPNPVLMKPSTTVQLTATALDQFGFVFSPQPTATWSIQSGSGSITASGLYTAPLSSTTAVILVQAGDFCTQATINIVDGADQVFVEAIIPQALEQATPVAGRLRFSRDLVRANPVTVT